MTRKIIIKDPKSSVSHFLQLRIDEMKAGIRFIETCPRKLVTGISRRSAHIKRESLLLRRPSYIRVGNDNDFNGSFSDAQCSKRQPHAMMQDHS